MSDNEIQPEAVEHYIPIVLCKARVLYKIHSRNLTYGVYDGKDGFIGIREKFSQKYLFTEYHWDTVKYKGYGTVKPLIDVISLPADIELDEHLHNEFGYDWAENPETKEVEPVLRRNLNKGEPQHGGRQGFVDLWGKNKIRLPDNLYPFMRQNSKLFDWLK
jgi:hypothetical protein